ncbi:hypothetical protein [Streptomyces pinistramenti]|uniref:hypothetical protein n=1 Tax=Streptomyces pinistramenti TaxID=2884812 RepID=UPI001D07011F|nr:hypothetical protein [Streptomyces pinistramenti]MCB5909271.1 hypothetical protein [Streptomyces pinistramenti]
MYEPVRLRAEDGPDFEQLLDRALRTPEITDALRRSGEGIDAGQLRAQALGSQAAIAAAAAAEYRTYLRLRTSGARPGPLPRRPGRTARATGGLLPALGVLVPGLAATAAAIFLLIGYGLRAVGMPSRLADELVFAGLTAACIAAAATLAGLFWMLVVAARNRAVPDGGADQDPHAALVRAREAWHGALLERGVLPFLLGRLDAGLPAGSPGPNAGRALPVTGVDDAEAAGRAGAGRQRRRGGPGYSAPDFASPDFSSPDFTGPEAPSRE